VPIPSSYGNRERTNTVEGKLPVGSGLGGVVTSGTEASREDAFFIFL
jgi:hypothetical protein